MLSEQLQRAKKVMSDTPRASGFCYWASKACRKLAYHSGGSRPSDKGEGGGHSDPEIRGREGGLQKVFFGPLGLSLI